MRRTTHRPQQHGRRRTAHRQANEPPEEYPPVSEVTVACIFEETAKLVARQEQRQKDTEENEKAKLDLQRAHDTFKECTRAWNAHFRKTPILQKNLERAQQDLIKKDVAHTKSVKQLRRSKRLEEKQRKITQAAQKMGGLIPC